jgi:hypothetical protein
LFKGRRVTGLTFTKNDADLTTKNCYVLERINSLQFGPDDLNLKKEEDFIWYTPVMFLKTGKFLAVKTIEHMVKEEDFGDDLSFEIYAEEYKMPVNKQSLHTRVYVSDYGLSNMVLRYPKEVNGRISEFDKLSEVFDRTVKFVELENPRIELRDAQEQTLQVEDEDLEAWFGIRSRINEAMFGKKKDNIGPEVRLFYGLAPSPEKVLYG